MSSSGLQAVMASISGWSEGGWSGGGWSGASILGASIGAGALAMLAEALADVVAFAFPVVPEAAGGVTGL